MTSRSLPTHMSVSLFVSLLLLLLTTSGCAHYYLPATQLETPETVGPGRIGRLELVGIQSGTDLITVPTAQSADPETGAVPDPKLSMTPANFVFGASLGISPRLDVGVRFQPFAPLVGRIKYQLTGEPESTAKAGNLSASLSGTAGLLLSIYAGQGVTFYTGNVAVIGGYRFADHHIASLAPFFSLAGLSGVGAGSGSGMRYGASLGYQYDIESVLFRADLTWGSGSISQAAGAANAGGFFPGAMLGFKL